MMKLAKWSLWLLSLSCLSMAHATIVIDEARVVSASKALAATVLPPTAVAIATAGTYTLTLSDVQKTSGPGAAFSSLSVVISQRSQLIKQLTLPTTQATTSTSVTLAAGQYQVQVLGVTPSVSQYGVDLKNAGNVSVWSDSAAVTAPPVNDFSSVQQTLNLTAGQSYTVTLSDRVFPTALTTLQATIVQDGNTVVCPLTAVATSATCVFTASANSNQLIVLASAATNGAGLYSVKVTNDSSGTIAYGTTLPLGTMPEPTSVNLPAADSYSLSSIDFQSPLPLATFKLALVQGAELLVEQSATGGPQTFNGTTGAASLYVIATAASGSAGQYSALIKRGTSSVATIVNSVTDTVATGLESYVFTATLPAAGNYTLQLRDFTLPQSFAALSASVSQDGALLGTAAAPGTLALNGAAAGDIAISVLAKPGTTATGLFGISLAASGSTTPLLEKTQGVGGSFTSQDVTIAAADHFVITATDFAAPVALNQLRVAITRGATVIGSIFGGGSLNVDATPGTYTLSFISTAQVSPGYGMYGISMATAPTVTLSASPGSVPSGGSTTLTWNSTDANSCIASGGWTGGKATNGTASVSVSADTTFTLTCTGVGGNTAKSTTVSIQAAAASSGGGGGGAESLLMLLVCGLLASVRYLRPRGD